MAVAWTNSVKVYGDNNNRMAQVDVVYVAAGLTQSSSLFVDISGVTTISQFSTILTSAIRADATALGISVPANSVWLPGYNAS